MDPFSIGCSVDEMIYSEWLESVRKDIECTFGIIKQRFRLFLNFIQYHSFEVIEKGWRAAIMLHNMLITYDGNDLTDWEKSLDWTYISPKCDDNFVESVMDDYYYQAERGSTIPTQVIVKFFLQEERPDRGVPWNHYKSGAVQATGSGGARRLCH